ncbi:MAG: zinc-dependent alcohol dehydrogenase [Candidatus Helarchaeota archaeon]
MTLIILNNMELPKMMNTVVLEKPYKLSFKKIPLWDLDIFPNADEMVLLKVGACGVCGSDYRYYRGENPWAQHTLGYHIDNKPNIVLGHEFAGTVVAVANKKNKNLLGKRVVAICSKVCGKCYLCKTNRPNLCPNTVHLGHGQGWGDMNYYPGAYAEYVPVWAAGCYEIPDNLTFEEAAMMDILAVCLHVYNQGSKFPELPVLIIGCGPAGNGIAQVARINGANKIIIIEKSELAIEIAKKNKFEYIINSDKKSINEIKDKVMQITDNHGCISVFDSVGTDFSFELGLSVLDKGGTLINMAVHDSDIKFNNMKISSERKITTSSNFIIEDYEKALKWLIEGRFDVKPWITKTNLSKIPEIFETIIRSDKKPYFKVVITDFKK